jgi:hypothetical protein
MSFMDCVVPLSLAIASCLTTYVEFSAFKYLLCLAFSQPSLYGIGTMISIIYLVSAIFVGKLLILSMRISFKYTCPFLPEFILAGVLRALVGSLTFVLYHTNFGKRFCIFSPESVILDICQCIEATDTKLEKRLRRLTFLIRVFRDNQVPLNRETLQRAMRVIHDKILLTAVDAPVQGVAPIDDLFNVSVDIIRENGLFDDMVDDPKTPFNRHCTKTFNQSGCVYESSACFAVIAFFIYYHVSRFICSELEWKLLSEAKLVFKGGAAIGKYLLRNFDLSPEDREHVRRMFIQGGDNDTSLCLTNLPDRETKDKLNEIHSCSKNLLRRYINCVSAVMNFFQADLLFRNETRAVINSNMAEQPDFSFNDSVVQSFELKPYTTVDGERYSKFYTISEPKSIYSSLTTLDFRYHASRTTFFLGRLKKSFLAVRGDQRASINSEIFDCSVISPLCVSIYDPTYVRKTYSFSLMIDYAFGCYSN